MGHGKFFNIIPAFVNLPSPNLDGDSNSRENHTENDDQNSKHLKANAAPLFDKKWNDAQAAQRRDNLTTLLPDNETTLPANNKPVLLSNGETALPTMRGTSTLPPQTGQANNVLNQSWQDLVSAASQHQDLKNFQHESPEFWDSVVKMSELRTIETYVNGQLEPRVTSRYGELLEVLNRQSGAAQIENFLNYLPSGEREVFLARYQIEQTFGTNELFVGRGIVPDVSGRFPLEVFLSANGKNPQVPVNTLLGLYGGDAAAVASGKAAPFLEQHPFIANYQFLFNPKSAALLGLSLAFFQNINALLSIDELTPEAFVQKTNSQFAIVPNQARLTTKNTFGKKETENQLVPKRFADETLIGGALINGALKTVEKYRKNRYSTFGLPADFDNEGFGFGFAAGATGAMMGATIGCIVPLAEKSVGEMIGFASSVVVGLTDAGLRSFGANALVSLMTSGVQSFLDASSINGKSLTDGAANKFLNGAEPFENDLRKNVFNIPVLVAE